MAQGLVGYWKLDEGSGTTAIDSTGYGNTGTLINSPSYTSSVPSAITFPDPYGLTFDGSTQYATFPASYTVSQIGTGKSWSFWVNTSKWEEQQVIIAAATLGWGGYAPWVIGTYGSSGVKKMRISIGWSNLSPATYYNGWANDWTTGDLATYVTNGVWANVIITYDGSTTSLYIGGTLVGTNANSHAQQDGAPVAMIMAARSLGNSMLTGSLDDVRIYNYALSQAEITSLASGSIQPLRGAWSVIRGNPSAVAVDSSGNGRHGTLVGKPSVAAPAPLLMTGNSFSFNGINQKIDIPTFNVSNITITAWIYANSVSNGVNGLRIVSKYKGTGSDDGSMIFDLQPTGKLRLVIASTGSKSIVSTSQTIFPGIWYHVAATYDGTTMTTYINGVVDKTGVALSGSIPTNSNNWGIGEDIPTGTTAEWWNGLIDDVRIYNTALSSGDISTLASGGDVAGAVGWWKFDAGPQSVIRGGMSSTESGLAGYWKLDEGSGTATTADSSGNGYTLTQNNSPTWDSSVPTSISFTDPYCFTFNGTNQYLSRTGGSDTILENMTAITISAWFKTTATSGGYIVSKTSSGGPGFGLEIGAQGTGRISFWAGSSFGITTPSTTPYNDGNWHNVVAINNGTTSYIYVDGILVRSQEVGNKLITTNTLTIGKPNFLSSYYFNGSIDDVRIYSRALTAQEITNLASGRISGTQAYSQIQ